MCGEFLPDRPSGFWQPRWRACYSSTYYALRDTRTPLRYALVHVGLATVLGYYAAIHLPPRLGLSPLWGTAGLTAAASVGGWVELILLRRTLNRRIGETGLPWSFLVRLWAAALMSAMVGWAIKRTLPLDQPIVAALLVLGPFGVTFFMLAFALGVPDARSAAARVRAWRL